MFLISTNQVDKLAKEYVDYYNEIRPHHALEGATPNEIFYKRQYKIPDKDEKYLDGIVRRRYFLNGLFTSYYIEKVA